MNDMRIRTKLALLRYKRFLTQKDVAKNVMYNYVTIGSVEKRRARASKRLILTLCDFYGKPREELFDDDGFALKLSDEDLAYIENARGVA